MFYFPVHRLLISKFHRNGLKLAYTEMDPEKSVFKWKSADPKSALQWSPTGRPPLSAHQGRLQRDLKRISIPTTSWEDIVDDRAAWRLAVREGVVTAEAARNNALAQKRASRKQQDLILREPLSFVCAKCSRNYHSRIGLFSHSRKCGSSAGRATPSSN